MEPEPEPDTADAVTPSSVPSRVRVTLFAGRSLPAEDWNTGKSDPYVEVRVLSGDAHKPVKSEKQQSTTRPETLDPVWNGEHFQLMDNLGATDSSWVRLKVWDRDHLAADDFIGMADMPLLEVQAASGHALRKELLLVDHKGKDVSGKNGRSRIEVEVSVFYNEDQTALVREHSVMKHCEDATLA